jgi:lycopene cyclase domain-containing protein
MLWNADGAFEILQGSPEVKAAQTFMKGFPFYWFVLALTFIGPFILGFHSSLHFNRSWRNILRACMLIMAIYIPWDILFTHWGVWRFNQAFTSDLYFAGLPIEEWLFFIATPFACLFVWRCILYYFPKMAQLGRTEAPLLSIILFSFHAILALLLLIRNPTGAYTTTAIIAGLGLTAYHFFFSPSQFVGKIITWWIILIPFFICNGILTGIHFWEYPILHTHDEWIHHAVVFYNKAENSGIRIWSVPGEDFFYGLGFYWLGLSAYGYPKPH